MTFMRKVLCIRIMKVTLGIIAIILIFNLAKYIYKEHFAETYISPEKGVAKIKELENENITSIRDKIDNNSENKDKENDKVKVEDFNKVFDESVIMGDSRGEGLTEYEILSPASVVAYKGRTVVEAKNDVDTVVDLAPSNIFLTYGMNDLQMFNNSKDFIDKYTELIKEVKSKLPDSKIYVTSIIPTNQKAIGKEPKFKNVYSFNKALKDMCKNLNIEFVDVNESINLESNLYEPDGIHFKPNFYKGYLNILKEKANL